MRKLIILLIVLVPFLANAQDAELDNMYLRSSFHLQDSSVTNITEGDTLATIEKVRTTINDSLSVFVGSQWADSTSGIVYADGNVGIGTADPLSALHINKGTGTGTGIRIGTPEIYEVSSGSLRVTGTNFNFSNTNLIYGSSTIKFGIEPTTTATATDAVFLPLATENTGLGRAGVGSLSFISNSKEIARASEATTEQFIINPQGDLTGTAAAPNLAFGDGDSGYTELTDDNIGVVVGGAYRFFFTTTYLQGGGGGNLAINHQQVTSATIPIYTFRGDENTGVNRAAADQLSLIAGGVEGLRINDAEAHSVAGITDYETLVTADDDIPNKKYVDDSKIIQTDTLQIGVWDMDFSANRTVAHGLNLDDIIGISSIMVRNDAETAKYQLNYSSSGTSIEGRWTIDATNVSLNRSLGGTFDSTDFDYTAGSWNRGWIIILHR